MRKDQARRLKYQEQQRIVSKVTNDKNACINIPWTWDNKLTKGQLKSFSSKLVK